MQSVKTLVDLLLKPDEKDWRTLLVRNWESMVGDLHVRMCLKKIQDTTLIIGVYDGHWMQELFMLSRVIIRRINEKLGDAYVTQVRFQLIERHALPTKRAPLVQRKSVACTLAPMHVKAIEHIQDDKLQEVLTKFYVRCAQSW